MCLSTEPKYQSACYNALLATSLQTNVKQEFEELQHKIEKKVIDKTGEKVWTIVLTGYTLMIKEEVIINTRIDPVADNLLLNIKRTNTFLNVTWGF